MIIDTSGLTGTDLTQDQFQESILSSLQEILAATFPGNFRKQGIKKTRVGYNFACPFCHDSATDDHKKRGHIILTGKGAGFYKCFNCGHTVPLNVFFKDFDHELRLSELNYLNQYILTRDNMRESRIDATSDVVDSTGAYEWAIDREHIKRAYGLSEITRETSAAWNYLVGRCQYTHYERYLYSPRNNQIWILNLVRDRVLGAQVRTLSQKQYFTFSIEKMRDVMFGDKTPVPESISRLSCVFNIFNIDFINASRPVIITEGPFDAFLLPNCIALAGANKSIPIEFPFYFLYDNDETGSKHAMEMLGKGFKTFMWKRFMQDYGIPDRNPYIKSGNQRKWDVTDVMKYARDYKIEKKIYWSPYFTNSMLDGLDI